MKTAEILTILYTLIGAFVAGFAAVEQKLIKKINKEAASAESNFKIHKLLPLSRWCFNHLKLAGAINEDKSGRLYFNESAYKALIKKRVLPVIIFIVTSGVMTIVFHR